jgi:hypothetical protein
VRCNAREELDQRIRTLHEIVAVAARLACGQRRRESGLRDSNAFGERDVDRHTPEW